MVSNKHEKYGICTFNLARAMSSHESMVEGLVITKPKRASSPFGTTMML